MKKHSGAKTRKFRTQQLEVQWAEPESFALTMQPTIDGDRVAREAAQRAADRAKSEQLQTEFMPQRIQP